jgi:hypothetical protein
MTVMSVIMLVVIAATFAFATATVSVSVNDARDHATGTITADGAAVNVSVGFTPKSILVTKVTNTLGQAYWVSGMTAASCLKSKVTGTTGGVGNFGLVSVATVSCLSAYSGSTSAAPGFTLGADTDINVSGDTLRFEAFR